MGICLQFLVVDDERVISLKGVGADLPRNSPYGNGMMPGVSCGVNFRPCCRILMCELLSQEIGICMNI